MATHAPITAAPTRASGNPIVLAFLAARANERQADERDDGGPDYSVDTRMAQFAEAGARDYVMTWGIGSAEHGALVALLAADALDRLIDGYSTKNDRGESVLTFGALELCEVYRIKTAMLHLWQHLDQHPRQLAPLALDMGLIDGNGNQVG